MTGEDIKIAVTPDRPFVEQGERSQLLHIDFAITNQSEYRLSLDEIVAAVYDSNGHLMFRRHVDANGLPPGTATIPGFPLGSGQSVTIFNPLEHFPAGMPLAAVRYEFVLAADEGDHQWKRVVEIVPPSASPARELVLPLRGRVLVYEAHDYFGHHRRLDIHHPVVKGLGLRFNSSRYSYDLSVVDRAGNMYAGDGGRNEDWYSWEQPVLAAGAGTVIGCAWDRPDYEIGMPGFQFPQGQLADPSIFLGNFVTIRHPDGFYSMTGHCRKDSLTVRPGDEVRAGDQIGLVGFSGSCVTVHTHLQLQDGETFDSEGVPSHFTRFRRLRGSATCEVSSGPIDSGEVVESLDSLTQAPAADPPAL